MMSLKKASKQEKQQCFEEVIPLEHMLLEGEKIKS